MSHPPANGATNCCKPSAPNYSASWMQSLQGDPAAVHALMAQEVEIALKHWAGSYLDHQIGREPPSRLRVLLGGRGAGKTYAGAGWINDLAQRARRLALVGSSLHDVREVMIDGPSGVRALATPGFVPRWEATRRRLVWDNGAVAQAFSAEDADALRGPQFHAAWADEFCAWRQPETVLTNLRMGLRLGDRPALLVTTTPRPIPALRRLIAEPGAEVVRAPTAENAHNLAPGFLDHLITLYGGTRLAAQELDGVVVEGEGALFRIEDLERARGSRPERLDRIVVTVDPPATAGGDACGIVVVGRGDDRAFVLADRSVSGLSPGGWAGRVVAAVAEFGAHGVVVETNQGGEMVRTVLAQAGCAVPIRGVHASRSKTVRAEPVALLYEQGRVVHCGAFPALEEEMMALGCGDTRTSPDRADALVWAVTELLLRRLEGPQLRWA